MSRNRINNLISAMSLQELAGQLNYVPSEGFDTTGVSERVDLEELIKRGQVGGSAGGTGANSRRKLQEIAVNESPSGVPLLFGVDVIHGHRTIVPIPLGLASTWNLNLIKKTAQMAAKEARADGINLNWSPMVDLTFDGRWGRIAEGSGELRHLANKISETMVQGYQGDDNKMDHPQRMMATMKHWFAYGLSARDYDTVSADAETLLEIMEPFKAGIAAGAGSLMVSFNTISRMPMTASRMMVHDLLRHDIGYDGIIVTDHTAIQELIAHGVANDLKEAAYLAFKAGSTLDLVSQAYIRHLPELVAEGEANPDQFTQDRRSGSVYTQGPITRNELEQAVRYNLAAKDRLGLLDNPYIGLEEDRAAKVTLTKANRKLARQAAAEACVLLKNERSALPLHQGQKIGVFGALAASQVDVQGTWAVSSNAANNISMLEGLRKNAPKGTSIHFAKGCNVTDNEMLAKRLNVFAGSYGKSVEIDANPQALLDEALELAKSCDTLMLVLGETKERSGEASTVQDISLSPEQQKLFNAMADYSKESGKRLVLVTMSGRPLALENEYKRADAILHTWHGGTEAGNGAADILYGKVNPSGRLSVAFPGHTGHLPFRTEKLPSGRPYSGPGKQLDSLFSKFTVECVVDTTCPIPMLPAGYGLSYTRFEYGDLKTDKALLDGDEDRLTVSLTLKNTGDRAGKETVQLYLHDMKGSLSRPVLELKGFQQVELGAGEEREVKFTLTPEDLKFYIAKTLRDYEYDWEGGEFEIMVGPNARDLKKVQVNWQRNIMPAPSTKPQGEPS
jgi:beta-glucosidase